MNERQLEAFFRKRVRLVGGYTFKLAPTEVGVPDRLVIMPGGRMFLVELKTETGALRPAQRAWHTQIRARGGRVVVLYGPESVLAWIAKTVDAAGEIQNRRRRYQRSA